MTDGTYDLPDREGEALDPVDCRCRYPRPDEVGECTRCRRLVVTLDALTAHATAGIHRLEQYLTCPDHPAWRLPRGK